MYAVRWALNDILILCEIPVNLPLGCISKYDANVTPPLLIKIFYIFARNLDLLL